MFLDVNNEDDDSGEKYDFEFWADESCDQEQIELERLLGGLFVSNY